jgi:hypothetical protein
MIILHSCPNTADDNGHVQFERVAPLLGDFDSQGLLLILLQIEGFELTYTVLVTGQ